MILSRKQSAVIYIDRTGFFFYGLGQLFGLRCEFGESVVNMDIVGIEAFEKQLQTFFETNKIPPVPVIFVLSKEVLFEKEFLKNKDEKAPLLDNTSEQIDAFLESVPFDHVVSKNILKPTGTFVTATNKELLAVLQRVLEKNKFTVEGIFPISCLGVDIPSGGITREFIELLFQKYDNLKSCNLMEKHETIMAGITPSSKEEFKKPSKRLIALVLIFALLLLAMIGLFIANYDQLFPKPSAPRKTPVTTQPQVIPTNAPTEAASPSASLLPSQVAIEIVQTPTSTRSATIFRNIVVALGFSQVTTRNAENISLTRNTILFSKTIPQNLRELLTSQLQKSISDLSILETESASNSAQIILAK